MSAQRCRLRAIGLVLLGGALVPAARVLASAAEGHGEHPVPAVGDLLLPAINFAIYAVIIFRYLVPALYEYLRRRKEEVVSVVKESASLRESAERAVAAAQARLAGLEAEAASIRHDMVTAATRQAERQRAHAEENGRRRLADAALVAEQERRRALESVRAEIAALAASLAERRIRAALTADDQREFVRRFLKDAAAR